MSEQITEKEARAILEYALETRDPAAAQTAIRLSVWDGVPIEKMADLHFSLMLLLAMPEPEKRGRPKDPDAENYTWYLNMACKIKAELDGQSFSKTWSAYCDRARPRALDYELWRCAGILRLLKKRKFSRAIAALNTFQLADTDLEPLAVVNK